MRRYYMCNSTQHKQFNSSAHDIHCIFVPMSCILCVFNKWMNYYAGHDNSAKQKATVGCLSISSVFLLLNAYYRIYMHQATDQQQHQQQWIWPANMSDLLTKIVRLTMHVFKTPPLQIVSVESNNLLKHTKIRFNKRLHYVPKMYQRNAYTHIELHILPSLIWHCWLGVRKNIWPVKTDWWRV